MENMMIIAEEQNLKVGTKLSVFGKKEYGLWFVSSQTKERIDNEDVLLTEVSKADNSGSVMFDAHRWIIENE